MCIRDRTGDEHYKRITKFFGHLFLINFAVGVVTGILQEFQFGMNWSEYSSFVGDVFGPSLAIEALQMCIRDSSSTGGFTDCALQNGAKFVYALDVGTNQLVWKLRNDERVKVMEQTNFRYSVKEDFDVYEIDVASIDVSFISLSLILPNLSEIINCLLYTSRVSI